MVATFKTSQRLLSLILCLSNHERGLTKAEIKKQVPSYDLENQDSADKKFERDKDVLAKAGIELELRTDYDGSQRYVLQRPRGPRSITLHDHHRLLLQAAASLWGNDDDRVFQLKVRSAFDESSNEIPRVQLVGSSVLSTLIRAQSHGRIVKFSYQKPGSAPEVRYLEPQRIFFENGHLYAAGYDRIRAATRRFRINRFVGVIEMLDETVTASELIDAGITKIHPIFAVRRLGAPHIHQHSQPLSGPLPPHLSETDWELRKGESLTYREWLDLVLNECTDLVVLAPDELTEAVTKRLHALASFGEEASHA
ncbi:MAG: WYL domain-containing protein [Actinomycetaceae bacterium]|nr:WYL domain-containing protein [Actinomycetaceae bacterium]